MHLGSKRNITSMIEHTDILTGELAKHIPLEKHQAACAISWFFKAFLPKAFLGHLEWFKGGINKCACRGRANVDEHPQNDRGKRNPWLLCCTNVFRKNTSWVLNLSRVLNLLLWFAAGYRIWETAVCAVIHSGWTNHQARFLQRTAVTIDGTAPQPRFRAWIHVPWFPIQTFGTLEQPKVGGCSVAAVPRPCIFLV